MRPDLSALETFIGITKCAGALACRYYRESRGVDASVGILFNHESPLHRRNCVSQKIARSAVKIARGQESKLTLGISRRRSTGDMLSDYVRAMTLIVRNATPY